MRSALGITVISVCLLCASCTQEQSPQVPSPSVTEATTFPYAPDAQACASMNTMWVDYIDQLYANGLSDFERQVLADCKVTDAEYAAAKDGFVSCMADYGWLVTWRQSPSSGYEVSALAGNSAADSSGANAVCNDDWIAPIEVVHDGMIFNPDKLTREQLIRQCYQEHGVSDGADASDDQFQQMMLDDAYIPSTPAAALCFFNPDGSFPYVTNEQEAWDWNQQRAAARGVTLPPWPYASPS